MNWPTGCIRHNESLANHTSFRIGGPAEWYAEPSTLDELVQLLREASRIGIPVSVLGGGTNTLAADRGVRGLVIHLGCEFRTIRQLSDAAEQTVILSCGAALLTQRLVSLAVQQGWGDLEALAGLPGQIAGAVAMNAQGIGRWVQRVRMVSSSGTVQELTQDELQFNYRDAVLPAGVVTEVVLGLPRVPAAEAASRIKRALNYRNTTQELRLPSAGCAFRNPPGGISAGRLIDQAGLKGVRIGDAQVSSRHANFIVNLGQARCEDVLALMEYVRRHVWRMSGVSLEPELRVLGEGLSLA